VRFQQVAGNTVLEMETNNDGVADMTIVLHGLHTITSSDYFL